jgi:hypothetical protein
VAHTVDAVHDAVQWVLQQTAASPVAIAVGIETPRGALVDTLLEYGFPMFAVNPKQLDRFRDRFTAGGAKDDRRDARVVADGLRTDRRAFRRIHADDARVIQLREWSIVEEPRPEQRLAVGCATSCIRVNAAWLTLNPAADDPGRGRSWVTSHPDAWATLLAGTHAGLARPRIRRLTADDVMAVLHSPVACGRGVAMRLSRIARRPPTAPGS